MSVVDRQDVLGTPLGELRRSASGVQSTVARSRPARRSVHRAVIVAATATPTNCALAEAFGRKGYCTEIAASQLGDFTRGDVIIGRLDVLDTLDGVEAGLDELGAFEHSAALLVNRPKALLSAHDKLLTALLLAHAAVRQPATAYVRDAGPTALFDPPYVVKPRFGSWGRDVIFCESNEDLRRSLAELEERSWFRRQGAVVQEFIPHRLDLRVVVAGGSVIGAVERVPPPGEWRTNVTLGAVRCPADPTPEAQETALRAVAALQIDLAGVDLVLDEHGRYVVLEINGAVDFAAEYRRDRNVFDTAVEALLTTASTQTARV